MVSLNCTMKRVIQKPNLMRMLRVVETFNLSGIDWNRHDSTDKCHFDVKILNFPIVDGALRI